MGEKHQLKHMDFTKSHHQIDDHQDMLRASPGIVGGKAAAAAFRANKFEEAESLYTEACQNKCRCQKTIPSGSLWLFNIAMDNHHF